MLDERQIPKYQSYDKVGTDLVFPLKYNPMPFVAWGMYVNNNTDAMLFVSQSNDNPSLTGKDITVPPRTMYPIFGWFSDRLFVGSDGTAIAPLDCVCIQVSDGPLSGSGTGIPVPAS